jgi:peroxiredoxin
VLNLAANVKFCAGAARDYTCASVNAMQIATASRPKVRKRMTAASLQAPELAVHTWFNTDRPLTLSALRGRVVVLVAFQALCPNSIAYAVPQARRIHETFEPHDVAVIGLHATFEHHEAYSVALLKAFIQEYRLKFPVALDSANSAGPIPQTMDRYNMRGTPSLVLIDRQGSIRKHAFGAADDLRIGAEIGALTQEAPVSLKSAQSSAA